MKKKTAIILMLIISFIGSIVNFYASNLVLGSVPALTYNVLELEALAAVPAFMLALDFVMGMLAVGRLYRYPRHRKEYILYNMYLLCIFSAIGFVGSVLNGTVVYGNFLAPYPFPGYCLIGTILHGMLLVYAIYGIIHWKKVLPEDPPSRKKPLQFILRSVLMPILIFLAQNRGGALLWSVTYLHLPTLYMTFPFYLSLLLPLALLFHAEMFTLGYYKERPLNAIRNIIALLIITVLCAIVVVWEGVSNTRFISVISPALGVERLLAKPVDTVVHFTLCFILGVWLLLYSIRKYHESLAEK